MSLSSTELAGLPQLSRDPYELIRLTPGVFGDGARSGGGNSVGLPNTTGPGGSNVSIFQTENQVPISANGQRLSNKQLHGGWGEREQPDLGRSGGGHSESGIGERDHRPVERVFAEYGRNSGAQVEVVSRTEPTNCTAAVSSSSTSPA